MVTDTRNSIRGYLRGQRLHWMSHAETSDVWAVIAALVKLEQFG